MAEQAQTAARRFGKSILYVLGRVPHWILNTLDSYIARCCDDAPYHPMHHHAWAANVEALYPEIRRDVERMLQHRDHIPTVHYVLPSTHLHYPERDWRQMIFQTYRHRIDDSCTLYPGIAKAIQCIPRMRCASISMLDAGQTIPAHEHIYKGFLIFHLGIVIPEGDCAIKVGGITRKWEEGKVFVIDPTYEHDAWNFSDKRRVVLLGEFSRPDMPRWLRVLDQVFMTLFDLSPPGRLYVKRIKEMAARHRQDVEGMGGVSGSLPAQS